MPERSPGENNRAPRFRVPMTPEGWQSMSQCSQPRGWRRIGGTFAASLVTAFIVAVPAQASTQPATTAPSLEIQAPEHVVAGQAITVTIAVRGARSVAGWEARVRFDSASAEFGGASGMGRGIGRSGGAARTGLDLGRHRRRRLHEQIAQRARTAVARAGSPASARHRDARRLRRRRPPGESVGSPPAPEHEGAQRDHSRRRRAATPHAAPAGEAPRARHRRAGRIKIARPRRRRARARLRSHHSVARLGRRARDGGVCAGRRRQPQRLRRRVRCRARRARRTRPPVHAGPGGRRVVRREHHGRRRRRRARQRHLPDGRGRMHAACGDRGGQRHAGPDGSPSTSPGRRAHDPAPSRTAEHPDHSGGVDDRRLHAARLVAEHPPRSQRASEVQIRGRGATRAVQRRCCISSPDNIDPRPVDLQRLAIVDRRRRTPTTTASSATSSAPTRAARSAPPRCFATTSGVDDRRTGPRQLIGDAGPRRPQRDLRQRLHRRVHHRAARRNVVQNNIIGLTRRHRGCATTHGRRHQPGPAHEQIGGLGPPSAT